MLLRNTGVTHFFYILSFILTLLCSDYSFAMEISSDVFNKPHVFITLSSIPELNEHGFSIARLIELNWYGIESTNDRDVIALFDYNPNGEADLTRAKAYTPIKSESGYYKTNISFGHIDLNLEKRKEVSLGYWIAYIRESKVLILNTFRTHPNWMHELKQKIGSVPLHSIMIPGTHDAGAIRKYDKESEQSPWLWNVCQEDGFYEQFVHGIRYVDIRVSLYGETFFINHGSVKYAPLETLFQAVKKFISETKEILIVDFHGFPIGFSSIQQHKLLLKFVQSQIGDLLVPYSTFGLNVTPDDLWNFGKRVILTYQDTKGRNLSDLYWPYLEHGWGDKNKVDALEHYFYNDALPNLGCKGKFWSAMAELTPTDEDMTIPKGGLRGYAQSTNIELSKWWRRPEWYSKTMIVSTDYFLGSNVIEMSVAVNRENLVCKGHSSSAMSKLFYPLLLLAFIGILYI